MKSQNVLGFSGIYMIQCKTHPSRIYIGSALNIQKRWWHHLSDLRKNKHHSPILQRLYNKYGDTELCFSVLTECSTSDLIEKEQFFIDLFKPSLNCSKIAGRTLGVKKSKKACLEQSIRLKGKKHTDEWNKNISLARKGSKTSEETRRKQSKIKKGKPSPMKGRKKEFDAIARKISEKLMGNKNKLGHKDSPDTIKKRSDSLKKNWAMRKLKKIS